MPFSASDVSKTYEQKFRQFVFFQYGLILFFLLVLGLSWGLSLSHLRGNRSFIVKGVNKSQANLTSIIAENLFQVLDQNKAIGLIASDWMKSRADNRFEAIQSFIYSEQAFNRIVFYDASGQAIYQSSPVQGEKISSVEIGALVRKLINSDQDLMFFPESFRGQRDWQIPLLFRLQRAAESDGVMLLELNLGYFLNLFQTIDIGRTGAIVISTSDGVVLASYENGGLALIDSNSPEKNRFARFIETSRKVENYPFVVTLRQSQVEALQDYDAYRSMHLWLLAGVTLVVIIVLFLMLQLLKRKRHYLKILSEAYAENQQLVARLEKEHENAVSAASFDALTGLYNRRVFSSLAAHNLRQARRIGLNLAVLFIDLDRFKPINDSLGHKIGDMLLKTIADRLKNCVRDTDIVARFGGDEFVVMLTGMKDTTRVADIAEKIITDLSLPCVLDGHQVSVTPSIGIALYPCDGEEIDSLVRNADAAMYGAKKTGRGSYCFFDQSLNRISPQQFELEQRIPAALKSDEFVLHYQPKVRLEDTRVVGLEALIRWDHPDYGLLYPNDFITHVEESGLIVEMGRWVLDRACRQIAEWRGLGLETVPVAVNVSPIEMNNKGYAEKFIAIIASHQLQAGDIHIEITESAIIENQQVVMDNLEQLARFGIPIALDDFGKGFSSFHNIRTLPLSTLKIDRSFIQDIKNNSSDNAIVSSAISLAKKLKLSVVAEGIESHDQLIHLKLAGCDEVQGYLFSRPVSPEQTKSFLLNPYMKI